MGTITILGKELTKQNQTCEVKLAQSIVNTPVVPFFLKNFAELIEQGYTYSAMSGSNQSKAIYVEINGTIIAHIVFDILKDAYNTAWIVFSCVDKNYRNQGIYKIMHRHFEIEAKKLGSIKIASSVHLDNKTRQASCKSVGMIPAYYRMEKDI
jgi:hypothetical protein